ncbi:hypothetical protein NSK_005709 [Nannochloropsis salina CCMP1776]|uniref:Uncharacterized protein n=1 Tax=Nannochloropsis salina CCMP1776 TaxID=1027361 RepID=A0A4D9CUK7_9STRA|nr:hypothetical protein NSK_005709 [Nannochloropsis salina CCMP1776]|eukprot:TFJ82981.1 hypothetical protein NSK_005709 [Nannochloropsis salina CCMP1776]
MFGFTRAGGSHASPSSSTFLPFRPYAAASGGAEGGSRQEKASTSSRTSLTLQGLSFAFNKMRRHPSQAEGDKKSIGVRSSPVIMNGRFYNPWNTDAAMKTLGEVFKAALDVHEDVRARHSFGIHWGTFPLAGDAWDEGPRELVQARADRNWPDDSFFLLRPGESWGVGEGRDGFLEHFKEEKRLPLSP